MPIFSREMSQIGLLASISWVYRFIHPNLAAIKFSMYVLYALPPTMYYVLGSEIDIFSLTKYARIYAWRVH